MIRYPWRGWISQKRSCLMCRLNTDPWRCTMRWISFCVLLLFLGVMAGAQERMPFCTTVFSGENAFDALTIPAGEAWCFDPNVPTTVQVTGNVVVYGTLVMQPADPSVTHTLRFTRANEGAF